MGLLPYYLYTDYEGVIEVTKDRYGYEDGRCTVCGNETKVRWKNIYLIGSEGTDMCESCERDMLRYLRDKSRFFAMERKEKYKAKKKEKKDEKPVSNFKCAGCN